MHVIQIAYIFIVKGISAPSMISVLVMGVHQMIVFPMNLVHFTLAFFGIVWMCIVVVIYHVEHQAL
jgi:hypothetical protein